MTSKKKLRLKLLGVVLLAGASFLIANPWTTGVGWLDKISDELKIKMGLDLQGGVHLVYQADMSGIQKGQEREALNGIQDVIERRVNSFGVSEPNIQPSVTGGEYRLIVELAGINDVNEAKNLIKETPLLEFKKEGTAGSEDSLTQEQKDLIEQIVEQAKLENEQKKQTAMDVLQRAKNGDDFAGLAKEFSDEPGADESAGDLGFFKKGQMVKPFEDVVFDPNFQVGTVYPELVETSFGLHIIKKQEIRGEGDGQEVHASHILFRISDPEQVRESVKNQLLMPKFEATGLTGKDLERAQVVFGQQVRVPEVSLQFNNEGTDLFKKITEENLGKRVAIFLDGEIISAPVVNDVIRNGQAVISGGFNLSEAKELAKRLNAGALPVPIELVSQQSVEASLGKVSLEKSLKAGLFGLLAVAIFMVLYYRLAGVVAVLALAIYVALMVSVFKLSSLSSIFGITLTLSGIAGFILSIGMAVDANILVFERMKEEIKRGRSLGAALDEGYRRAWPSIRDGNFSTILTCLILMTFGTGFIKGFAIILFLGVIFSMLASFFIARIIFESLIFKFLEKHKALVLIGSASYNKSEEKKK